jgi:hypothetical protein
LDGQFVISFLLNRNTVLDGLTLAKEVDTVFVLILDLVGGRGVQINVLDYYRHLVDYLCGLFVTFFNKVQPFDIKPISLFPSLIFLTGGCDFYEIFSIIRGELTIFKIIGILLLSIAFIEFWLDIPNNIAQDNLDLRTFLLSGQLD